MINAAQLLADLTRQLKRLEDDLRARVAEVPELKAGLATEWQAARDAERTAETFESWADQVITQAGVHWLLSCVFLRFIEDNQLVDRPWLSGPHESGRLTLAQDRHEAYFRTHPLESDREYLLAAFREAGALPGLKTFFDEAHNPVFRLGVSGDAAMALRQFWQQRDPNTGALLHDFTDGEWGTRFLGDLYQDLSEEAKKRYALLQTPEFVEEFILDRTLTPAIREFGFREVRLIDPTCGSGHFLLGAFRRLVDEWARNEPGRNVRDVAQKALDAVAGVDLNPFAVAIARFRLLVAALKVSDVHRLIDAPNFRIDVAIGDSLLHGSRFGLTQTETMFEGNEHYAGTGMAHAYATEDLNEVQRILGRQYHAVVGNPPYITVKDRALSDAYRQRYVSCYRLYSLGCPFTERFFELAITGNDKPAGYVGLITANSFMKREFGSKLIEEVLPRLDLSHVVDTSGAYIPGHGTPTVIMFGRHRVPVGETVRTVMGIKGEPSTPENPSLGLVWSAILGQIDNTNSDGEFVSVRDTPRATFSKHPWSIGGGGASELRKYIEELSAERLAAKCEAVGFYQDTHADDVFVQPLSFFKRMGGLQYTRFCIRGDGVRDWIAAFDEAIFFPYDSQIEQWSGVRFEPGLRWLWPYRTTLWSRSVFGGQTYRAAGRPWWDYHQFPRDRARAASLIAFAEIASHNHFILDRGGKVFNRTAPVIKLPDAGSEADHLALLGLLNSSVTCFWLKQVCHQKQMMGGDGIRISERSKVPYQFASTRVQELPLPGNWETHPDRVRLGQLAREADELASEVETQSAATTVARALGEGRDIVDEWQKVLSMRRRTRARMILVQEEIDFLCYYLNGLIEDRGLLSPRTDWEVLLDAGCRPFCILSQKNVDGFSVPQAVPADWPESLRNLWSRRLEAIRSSPALKVFEDPHYKRRWIGRQGLFNHDAKTDELNDALATWLLDRLEACPVWQLVEGQSVRLMTTSLLADAVRSDGEFQQVAAVYSGHAAFDLDKLVGDLVERESVPFLPVLRYKDSGLRKRAQWDATWELQRREDSGESVGQIPVPPKYEGKDFLRSDYSRLRGALDIPKERWISYPGCERGADGSLPIAWAGWNYLQQATALASYYLAMKDSEGWEPARLHPLLAGLLELVPWLKQWHNELNPEYGERMGDYYEGFVRDEARGLGVTLEELKAWKPARASIRRRRTRVAVQ